MRLGENHFHKISNNQMKSIFTIPLYIAALFLHQVTAEIDDKMIIFHYNSSNVAFRSKGGSYVSANRKFKFKKYILKTFRQA